MFSKQDMFYIIKQGLLQLKHTWFLCWKCTHEDQSFCVSDNIKKLPEASEHTKNNVQKALFYIANR